jgi:long-chain-fatty-acid--CoA ligase ACSBG
MTLLHSGIGCGIYTTNSADACEYILQDCGARIVVVENQLHLNKILKCKEACRIDAIIQYTGAVENNYGGLVKTVGFLDLFFIRLKSTF